MKQGRLTNSFIVRIAILLALLVLVALGWLFVQGLGGPVKIIPALLQLNNQREAASAEATSRQIRSAMSQLRRGDALGPGARIDAARALAEEALSREKSRVESGLSVSTGKIAAQMRIANNDYSDLHQAADLLTEALRSKSERLRLEASYALSHLQLHARYSHLVQPMLRALDKEHSVAIKAYLARALGDIGPPAAIAVGRLAELLEEDDPKLLASAAGALGRIGPAGYQLDSERHLLGLLSHHDAAVREASAEALGAIGAFSHQVQSGLRQALEDEDLHVRVAAALGLADLMIEDEQVLAALASGYRLKPRTTLYVEDVARVYTVQRRIAGVFARLGEAPDEFVPALVEMAKQTGDIMHKESMVALIAKTEQFSQTRAETLIDLLQDPRFGFYYAVVDGLVEMGPEVLPYVTPLLEHEQKLVRELAAETQRKLKPRKLKTAPKADPALMTAYAEASNSVLAQEIAVTMAKTGDPAMLDFLQAHADDRVMNGPVLLVVIRQLIADLRQYLWTPTEDLDARRAELRALRHLGVLDDTQHDAFAAEIENPELGDKVQEIWRAQRAKIPRRPSEKEVLAKLYAELPPPRHNGVAQYAKQLQIADPAKRIKAVNGLGRIAEQAVEAPLYLRRAIGDPYSSVRSRALELFVHYGPVDAEAMPMLSEILVTSGQNGNMNQNAAKGLAKLGTVALGPLRDAAAHADHHVRRASAFGLLKLGPDAASETPLLQRLAQDPHLGVRTYAEKALAGLENPT